MRTPSRVAVLSLIYSLYLASLPVSAAINAPKGFTGVTGRLSDQNLFEVHLQKSGNSRSSPKRLPSDMMHGRHGERSEIEGVQPQGEQEEESEDGAAAPAAPASVAGSAGSIMAAAATGQGVPSSTASASSSSNASTRPLQTFSPRQPSHFIGRLRHKNAKRRLTNQDEEDGEDVALSSGSTTIKFERDSDDIPSLWYTTTEAADEGDADQEEGQAAPSSSSSSTAADGSLPNRPSFLHDLHLLCKSRWWCRPLACFRGRGVCRMLTGTSHLPFLSPFNTVPPTLVAQANGLVQPQQAQTAQPQQEFLLRQQ